MKSNILYTEDEVKKAYFRMAELLDTKYKPLVQQGQKLLMLGILRGGVTSFVHIAEKMNTPHEWGFVTASSYVNNKSTAKDNGVTIKEMPTVDGYHVVFVDDIRDSGATINAIIKETQRLYKPLSISVAVLVDRISTSQHPLPKDIDLFSGINHIGDEYMIGCGMDDNGKSRNLPYIGFV